MKFTSTKDCLIALANGYTLHNKDGHAVFLVGNKQIKTNKKRKGAYHFSNFFYWHIKDSIGEFYVPTFKEKWIYEKEKVLIKVVNTLKKLKYKLYRR